jgi:hypothetical protein
MDALEQHKAQFAADRISFHEKACYDNFSFFVTLSTAIFGGLGYLAVNSPIPRRSAEYWIVQRVAWGACYLEAIVGWFFALMVLLHYISIRRQWKLQVELGIKQVEQGSDRKKDGVPWSHLGKHVQLYMMIAEVLLPIALYCYLVRPLFG